MPISGMGSLLMSSASYVSVPFALACEDGMGLCWSTVLRSAARSRATLNRRNWAAFIFYATRVYRVHCILCCQWDCWHSQPVTTPEDQ